MPIAKPGSPLKPDFNISIDGVPLPDRVDPYIAAVTIDCDTALPSMFAIDLTGAETQQAEIPWIDDRNLFEIGKVVEIELGYAGDVETLIVGEIASLEPEFAFNRKPSFTVRGYDRRYRLQRGQKDRTFVRQKDSDIAAQIAREAGLTARTTDSQIVYDYTIQAGQTDMEFLQERAYQIGYEVLMENKTLIFRPVAHAQSPILTLTLDRDLLEFCPRLSMAEQVSEAIVRGWNVKEKTAIVGRASKNDVNGTMGGQSTGAAIVESKFGTTVGVSQHQPVTSQAEADRLAQAKLDRSTLKLITGEGICWGRTDLRPGKVINIDGIGQRFSGQYYVTTAIHRYTSADGYQTRFTVRRNAS
jgi:uncharacterized protein